MGTKQTTILGRTTFEISRTTEYFTATELEAQTGHPRTRFGDVALKELMDNALDAAEAASVAPEVGLDLSRPRRPLVSGSAGQRPLSRAIKSPTFEHAYRLERNPVGGSTPRPRGR